MKADRAETDPLRTGPAELAKGESAAVPDASPSQPAPALRQPGSAQGPVLSELARAPMREPKRAEGETLVTEGAERPRARRRWVVVAVVVGLGVLAYLLFHRGGSPSGPAAASTKGKGSAPIPVIAVAARTGDFPVYLNALGTAAALNTVAVRTRVDGQLIRVAFQEGQSVRAGDLLAEIDPRPFQVQLTQAEGQLAKDEATLRNARRDFERYQILGSEGTISRQQVDAQATTVAQYEAAVKTDQGLVGSARLNLTYCRITAPISGRVGLRLVDPGNMVRASDPSALVMITQLQPIAVLFPIPEDNLPTVLQRTRGGRRLKVEAFDRDQKNQLATGELLTVDNQIDQATGTVRLKAIFSNQDNRLFPNQFVNARLQLDILRGATIIPAAALQRSPQSTYVYVVMPDQTVAMRTVEVQLTEAESAVTRRGVAAGELVVVDGLDKLQEGSKVVVRPPEQKRQPARSS